LYILILLLLNNLTYLLTTTIGIADDTATATSTW